VEVLPEFEGILPAHQLAGREGIARGTTEWFTNEDRKVEDRKMGKGMEAKESL